MNFNFEVFQGLIEKCEFDRISGPTNVLKLFGSWKKTLKKPKFTLTIESWKTKIQESTHDTIFSRYEMRRDTCIDETCVPSNTYTFQDSYVMYILPLWPLQSTYVDC